METSYKERLEKIEAEIGEKSTQCTGSQTEAEAILKSAKERQQR